jgi:hypothetical protein
MPSFVLKSLFDKKILRTVICPLLKKLTSLAHSFGTYKDILKIQTDLNSTNQMLSLEVKFMFVNNNALLKIS